MAKGALIHRDFSGRTPLHLAARHDYQEAAQILLAHYKHLRDTFDRDGNTALHLAAANNASKAVKYLLDAKAVLSMNQLQQTALDIAIQHKHSQTANAMIQHDRWREILQRPSVLYRRPILGLIEHLPETMMGALDRCVVKAPCDTMSKDFYIHFDFRLLEPPNLLSNAIDETAALQSADVHEPLLALNAMVQHGRCELLQHPVCSSLLNKKWASYGIYSHGIQVVIYAIYLSLLTYLVCGGVRTALVPTLKMQTIDNIKTHYDPEFDSGNLPHLNRSAGICTQDWQSYQKVSGFYPVANLMVLMFALFNMVKESAQFASQRKKYLKEYVNYLEWILYICTAVFVLGFYDEEEQFFGWSTRWQFGAWAIFLAWFTFMLYLQRFGLMGIYVVMFLGILKTLLRAMLVFSFLIVAFALAFHVLLPIMLYPNDPQFYRTPDLRIDLSGLRTPHLNMIPSILRISTMGLGDLDMVSNYIYPSTDGQLPFPNTTYIFLWMVIIAISILLMNLMIGLAVGDIEKVQASATLRRIAMQVELHTNLERRLPGWILSRVNDIQEDRFYPNRCTGNFRRVG
ncbi:hypothetical protein RvY_03783-2 [Ramazzottius varieornatus]|uniref:Ion transport domain-containing protein n=1 Tax=Ramazzottius varieornatus TaxID=947166 RepID=A0A1D1UUX8_RAMVA|nr:hypothetical protein RvY_03783-2 [Ramazzottius varieornatus]